MKPIALSIPVWIEGSRGSARVWRRAPMLREPDADQPIGKLVRDLFESQELPGARRALHFEIVAIIIVKFLQRFDEEIIEWKPDRATPVRVAAEHTGSRFTGVVIY